MQYIKYTTLFFSLLLSVVSNAAYGPQHLNAFALKNSGQTMDYHQTATSVPGKMNDVARFLVDQLAQNRDSMNISQNTIAVTSIVDLESYKTTNKVGLWLSENLMHELHTRGFKTIDFKMMPAIQVTQRGDFALSKHVKELKSRYSINQVLTGTYAEHENGILINLRLIDMESSVVVSSAQANISRGSYLRMLNDVSDGTPKVVIERQVVPEVKTYEVELRGEAFCEPSQPCFYQ